MKLLTVALPLLFAATAIAQGVLIAVPTEGQNLTIGQPFTVEIDKPNSLGGGPSVSVAIGLQLCAQDGCSVTDNDGRLGRVLFAGPYVPEKHEAFKQPYENYTVTVPEDATPQTAVLHVIHFWLVGAGPFPILQARNVSVSLTQAGESTGGKTHGKHQGDHSVHSGKGHSSCKAAKHTAL